MELKKSRRSPRSYRRISSARRLSIFRTWALVMRLGSRQGGERYEPDFWSSQDPPCRQNPANCQSKKSGQHSQRWSSDRPHVRDPAKVLACLGAAWILAHFGDIWRPNRATGGSPPRPYDQVAGRGHFRLGRTGRTTSRVQMHPEGPKSLVSIQRLESVNSPWPHRRRRVPNLPVLMTTSTAYASTPY